jgi:3-hydroxyisobutyrate dehydrogenase-like beta-hydroxyacid dehydrogenase
MIMGSMMGAFAEGLALAQGADLPLDALLQVGVITTAVSRVLQSPALFVRMR